MSLSSATYPSGSLLATEIAQQPDVWPTTLDRVQSFLAAQSIDFSQGVMFTGAGTSAYAGSAIAESWPTAMAVATTDLLLQSPESIRRRHSAFVEGGVLVSLARSGDSPESAAVVEKFQKHFPAVKHVAIICNAQGRLAQVDGIAAIRLDSRTNDRSLAMTCSFSNLVLGGLALFHNAELAPALPSICKRVEEAFLEQDATLQQIAEATSDRVVILASGMQALCQEAALKIVELTAGKVMAMHESFLGFRHGSIGFLREDTPILCFLSSDPYKRRFEEDVIRDLQAKGLGRAVIIGGSGVKQSEGEIHLPVAAPGLEDGLRTPFEITLVQLLAYHLSVAVKVDPDNPSPDGTITRVVRPFHIHAA